ncbi:hypothetical protein ARAM_001337 [Aspergillus rambellii]|uniref:Uncharacterized protein n=1 Tax=Aspergillus rambellii TaxID=308745 RepID=A0A0F8X2I8_9EURO|nr:hypothetical protein ARAM_001337 [Aspergillus rambellii]
MSHLQNSNLFDIKGLVAVVTGGGSGDNNNNNNNNPDGPKPSISAVRDALWSVPMADFSRVFEVNASGAYYTVIAFLTLLDAANKRRARPEHNRLATPVAQVVVVSSIAGFMRRVPLSFAYSLSKAAANHLVKVLATALAPYLIRVNGIAPGLFYSELSSNDFSPGECAVSGRVVPAAADSHYAGWWGGRYCGVAALDGGGVWRVSQWEYYGS